jgi:hypothetical protein
MPNRFEPENKPTKQQLLRFVELKERKRLLDAEVRAIESELYTTHELCMEYLEAKGVSVAKLHRFTIAKSDGQAVVKWKEEFIRVCGAEEAAALSADAPRAQRLEVRPPG